MAPKTVGVTVANWVGNSAASRDVQLVAHLAAPKVVRWARVMAALTACQTAGYLDQMMVDWMVVNWVDCLAVSKVAKTALHWAAVTAAHLVHLTAA